MTPEQLAEIRQRADAATPGPWVHADEHADLGPTASPCWCICQMRPGYEQMGEEEGYLRDVACMTYNTSRKHHRDAEFIAAARQDVPDLLAHIDAQSAEITRLRQQLAQYADGRPSLYRDPKGPTP